MAVVLDIELKQQRVFRDPTSSRFDGICPEVLITLGTGTGNRRPSIAFVTAA